MHYKKAGFTLIELLVAISILAIVAVLGFRGLDSIIRSRTILTADLEQTRSLQITFAQLQSDCLQTVNQLSYPNLPEGTSVWVEPKRLTLIRNDYSDDQAPAMQVVVYRIKNSSLIRFESDSTRDLEVLKKLLLQARNLTDDQTEIVMQKEVQDIQFRGYSDLALQAGGNPFDNNPSADPSSADEENPSGASGGPTPGGAGQPETRPGEEKGAGAGAGLPGQGIPGQGIPGQGGGIQNVDMSGAITGLQVQLQLSGHDKKMYKIFVVGGS